MKDIKDMDTNYRLLLEKFLSYFEKGVSVAEIPGKIVVLGKFYKNYKFAEQGGYEYERFYFDIDKSANETCKEVLQGILDDSWDGGFEYYPEGDEIIAKYGGINCHQISRVSIDNIKDDELRNSLLASDIDTSSPSIDLPIP